MPKQPVRAISAVRLTKAAFSDFLGRHVSIYKKSSLRAGHGTYRLLLLQSPNKLHPCSDTSNTLKKHLTQF